MFLTKEQAADTLTPGKPRHSLKATFRAVKRLLLGLLTIHKSSVTNTNLAVRSAIQNHVSNLKVSYWSVLTPGKPRHSSKAPRGVVTLLPDILTAYRSTVTITKLTVRSVIQSSVSNQWLSYNWSVLTPGKPRHSSKAPRGLWVYY